jgi:four helix bundle protein
MAFLAMEVAIEMVRQLREPLEAISQHDGDLASQLRRAAASVPLNLAEAGRRVGRDRFHQFRVASGSAAEVTACLQVAEAFGYVEIGSVAGALRSADRVCAMTWSLTH